jgi:hypothetical protein
MILVNFSHPLSTQQLHQVEELSGQAVERVIDAVPHFDDSRPFVEQATILINSVKLTPEERQISRLLVNLPGSSIIAALVLAEVHGRAGYFPVVMRVRRVSDSVINQYEAAEIISLQDVRDGARTWRSERAGNS